MGTSTESGVEPNVQQPVDGGFDPNDSGTPGPRDPGTDGSTGSDGHREGVSPKDSGTPGPRTPAAVPADEH